MALITDMERIQQMIWQDCTDNPKQSVRQGSEMVCGHCLGMGCLSVDAPVGHPAFGRAFRCICRRNAMTTASIRAMLELNANLSPEDAEMYSFSDFEKWPDMQDALFLCQMIAAGEAPEDREGIGRPGLILMGDNGIGKTTLAAIIFREWAARGTNVVWVDYTRLIKQIQATYDPNYVGLTEQEIMDYVSGAQLLVLDDLGAVAISESRNPRASINRIEIVFQIIHHRYNKHLPTIITTNLSERQVEAQFERRVASRLFGMCHAVQMQSHEDMRRRSRQWAR